MKNNKIILIITIIAIVIVGIIIGYINVNDVNNTKDNIAETEEEIVIEILLKEKFDLGLELIGMNPNYFQIEEVPSKVETSEEGLSFGFYKVLNYDDICKLYLTDNAKKYVDENGICLVWIDNEPYVAEGGGGKSVFGGIEFENVIKTDDRIEADAVMTMIDFDEQPYKYLGKSKSKFILKYENETWKIDEFSEPSDYEKWEEILVNEK